MVDKLKVVAKPISATFKYISPKINIIRAILHIFTAVGFISVILTLVGLLIINRPISKIVNTLYYKKQEQKKIIKTKMIDTYYQTLSPNENKLINITEEKENEVIHAYGPNIILKYYGYLNLINAILFLIMGIVYVMSEYQERNYHNAIKACAKKI